MKYADLSDAEKPLVRSNKVLALALLFALSLTGVALLPAIAAFWWDIPLVVTALCALVGGFLTAGFWMSLWRVACVRWGRR